MNNVIESQEEINGKIKNLFNEPQEARGGMVDSNKSSTNEYGSDLYFEKGDDENLDKSTEMKL